MRWGLLQLRDDEIERGRLITCNRTLIDVCNGWSSVLEGRKCSLCVSPGLVSPKNRSVIIHLRMCLLLVGWENFTAQSTSLSLPGTWLGLNRALIECSLESIYQILLCRERGVGYIRGGRQHASSSQKSLSSMNPHELSTAVGRDITLVFSAIDNRVPSDHSKAVYTKRCNARLLWIALRHHVQYFWRSTFQLRLSWTQRGWRI